MGGGGRVLWLDAAKGLGISLIVIGHVWSLSDPPLFYLWLFAFHVPLFFFISGTTFKVKQASTAAVLAEKSYRLITPYIWFALLGYALYLAGYFATGSMSERPGQFDYGLWVPLVGILHGTAGEGYLVNSPLWFLPALLVTYTLAYVINTYLPSKAMQFAATAGLMMIGLFINDQIRLPWGIVPALIAVGFFQTGHWMMQTSLIHKFQSHHALIAGVVLLLASLLAPINGAVGLAGPTVNNPVLFIIFAFVGTGACISWVYALPARLQHGLALIGRHSLAILVTHMLIIKGIKVILQSTTGWTFTSMEVSSLQGIVVLLLTAASLLIAIPLIRRIAPFTLGERKGPAFG